MLCHASAVRMGQLGLVGSGRREARGSPSLHLLLGCTAKDYSDDDDTA